MFLRADSVEGPGKDLISSTSQEQPLNSLNIQLFSRFKMRKLRHKIQCAAHSQTTLTK